MMGLMGMMELISSCVFFYGHEWSFSDVWRKNIWKEGYKRLHLEAHLVCTCHIVKKKESPKFLSTWEKICLLIVAYISQVENK